MRNTTVFSSVLVALLLSGCGGSEQPTDANPAPTTSDKAAAVAPTESKPAPAPAKVAKTPSPGVAKPHASSHTREAVDPDGALMNWIFVDWAGIDPQLEETAATTTLRVKARDGATVVNEFTRADVEAQELARLQALFQKSLGYGSIVTNIGGTLSQYDMDYGEFFLSQFAPGSTVQFGYTGSGEYKHVQQFLKGVQLDNLLEAYIWKVSPEEAQKIIGIFEQDRNKDRKIYTRIKMTITGVDVEKGLLLAHLDSYELFTNPNQYFSEGQTKLAEASF